jgi:hypothetical protein
MVMYLQALYENILSQWESLGKLYEENFNLRRLQNTPFQGITQWQ